MKPGTPLPWETVPCGSTQAIIGFPANGIGRYTIANASLGYPLTLGEGIANAAYITHACNLYPRLVQTLAECTQLLNRIQEVEDGPMPMPWSQIDKAEQLLAQCEPDGYPSGTVDDVDRYPEDGKCEEER